MNSFQMRKLSELADIVTGTTPSSKQPEAWGNELDFITPSDQSDFSREANPSRFLSSYGSELFKKRIVPAGSTNLTCIGSTIGKVSMAMRPSVTNQQINSIVAKNDVADPIFIYYMIRNWSGILKVEAAGSATPIINKTTLSNYLFAVPPLAEQRAIAEVLGALDDKIAANNKVIQLADSFTEAIAEKAFSSGKLVPLASIADITMGNSPKGETLNELGDGVPFFQGIRDFGVRYPEVRVSTTAPTRFANELDTLFSVRAPVGTSNLAGFSCSIGRGISAFSSRTETPYALFQAVRISKVWERYNAEGTVFGSINRKQLEQSEIKWVDGSRLQELESTLSNVENILHAATSMNTTLAATRDALLPQLMSGKMRVREAEAVVEDVL